MILVDTSVWVDHLRAHDQGLHKLLEGGLVRTHPFIIGEIALGNLRQRNAVISALRRLPRIAIATDDEVLFLVERHSLAGLGIGYVDTHLLASTLLTPGTSLWTRDERLARVAAELQVGFETLPSA